MKPNPDYLKKILTAFRDAPNPTIDLLELESAGIDYEEPSFEFHMHLLLDDGAIESDSQAIGFGLQTSPDGYKQWSVIPLRLTASGHNFAEALQSSTVMTFVKKNLTAASVTTIRELAVAAAKAELAKRVGLHLP